jgi:hypothetical protein
MRSFMNRSSLSESKANLLNLEALQDDVESNWQEVAVVKRDEASEEKKKEDVPGQCTVCKDEVGEYYVIPAWVVSFGYGSFVLGCRLAIEISGCRDFCIAADEGRNSTLV